MPSSACYQSHNYSIGTAGSHTLCNNSLASSLEQHLFCPLPPPPPPPHTATTNQLTLLYSPSTCDHTGQRHVSVAACQGSSSALRHCSTEQMARPSGVNNRVTTYRAYYTHPPETPHTSRQMGHVLCSFVSLLSARHSCGPCTWPQARYTQGCRSGTCNSGWGSIEGCGGDSEGVCTHIIGTGAGRLVWP